VTLDLFLTYAYGNNFLQSFNNGIKMGWFPMIKTQSDYSNWTNQAKKKRELLEEIEENLR
jgi:hypothetical protein